MGFPGYQGGIGCENHKQWSLCEKDSHTHTVELSPPVQGVFDLGWQYEAFDQAVCVVDSP